MLYNRWYEVDTESLMRALYIKQCNGPMPRPVPITIALLCGEMYVQTEGLICVV